MNISAKNKEAISSLLFGLAALVVATLLIKGIGSLGFGSEKNASQEQVDRIEENVNNIAESLTPYESKEKMSVTRIVDSTNSFSNSTTSNEVADSFETNFSVSGELKRGYLYVKASVDNQPLTRFDDVYLKVSGKIGGEYIELGGHLIESRSLETPRSDAFTELLFDLTDVKYKEKYTDFDYQVLSGNWLEFFNNGRDQLLISFVSTERQGRIDELAFYYECKTEACVIR